MLQIHSFHRKSYGLEISYENLHPKRGIKVSSSGSEFIPLIGSIASSRSFNLHQCWDTMLGYKPEQVSGGRSESGTKDIWSRRAKCSLGNKKAGRPELICRSWI
uniref:Uncharacterized protein n=1 Tax=Arundo donax TaxID=35708 RepID=A0A0A9FDT8_ARUDO